MVFHYLQLPMTMGFVLGWIKYGILGMVPHVQRKQEDARYIALVFDLTKR